MKSLIQADSYELSVKQGFFSGCKIAVSPVDQGDELLGTEKGKTAAQAHEEFLRAHHRAADRVAEWLERCSSGQLQVELSRLSGQRVPSLNGFDRRIQIQYLAMGWKKVVYRVEFQLRPKGNKPSPLLLLKLSKYPTSVGREELQRQRWMEQSGFRGVPRLGKIFEDARGVDYFEEFIDGPSVLQLRRQGAVTDEVRRSILRTLLSLYAQLGLIPSGIRPKQFLMRNGNSGECEAVMVDLGGSVQTEPWAILDLMHLWYGSQGHGLLPAPSVMGLGAAPPRSRTNTKAFSQNGSGDGLIFSVAEEVLGSHGAQRFLKAALRQAVRHPWAPGYRFTSEDFFDSLRKRSLMKRAAGRLWMDMVIGVWQIRRQKEFRRLRKKISAWVNRTAASQENHPEGHR